MPEVHKFDAKIQNIMEMIIKNVYSDKSASIRELISNASDALDKYVTNYALIEEEEKENINNLKINLEVNETEKFLIIEDNGIGMTYKELIEFIGSIANSGTKQFKKDLLSKNTTENQQNNLIGQFGVGFYSSFLIAEKVEMITKKAGHPSYKFISKSYSEYETEELKEDIKKHGTRIKLFIKEGNEKYLKIENIKKIIEKHSNFINYPIFIEEEKEIKEDTPEDNKVEEVDENKIDEVKKQEQIRTERVQTQINSTKPLWTKDPSTIEEKEYIEFYKSFTKNWDEPLAYKHVRLEGIPTNFEVLLFIPKNNQTDFFSAQKQKSNIKLYCQNIFITEELEEIIPSYFSFVYGVISAPNLPVNISREMLQGDKTMKQIKRILNKQILNLIEQISFDEKLFEEFYAKYSDALKLAIKMDCEKKEDLVEYLKYKTNKRENISFNSYKENMKENQKQIYVLTALSEKEASNSPFLEIFNKKDLEVFLMDSPVDEIMLQNLRKYKEFDIQRINTDGLIIEENELEEDKKKEYDNLIEKLKKELNIENIQLKDLGTKPFLIISSKFGQSSAMKTLMHSQMKNKDDPFAMMMKMDQPILQVNYKSKIIEKLKESKDEDFSKLSKLLYSTALAECSLLFLDSDKVKEHCELIYEIINKRIN